MRFDIRKFRVFAVQPQHTDDSQHQRQQQQVRLSEQQVRLSDRKTIRFVRELFSILEGV